MLVVCYLSFVSLPEPQRPHHIITSFDSVQNRFAPPDRPGYDAEIMLRDVFKRLTEKDINLKVTDAFKERLVDEGFNPAYGARPLSRAIMRLLEDVLAEEILSDRLSEGDTA